MRSIAKKASTRSQLEAYIASTTDGVIEIQGDRYAVTNFSHEAGLGFFADFNGEDELYFGMQMDARLINRPGAEVWHICGSKGESLIKFCIHNGELVQLAGFNRI